MLCCMMEHIEALIVKFKPSEHPALRRPVRDTGFGSFAPRSKGSGVGKPAKARIKCGPK
jgi:hypothetical protein